MSNNEQVITLLCIVATFAIGYFLTLDTAKRGSMFGSAKNLFSKLHFKGFTQNVQSGIPLGTKIATGLGIIFMVGLLIMILSPEKRTALIEHHSFVWIMIFLFGGYVVIELLNRQKGLQWMAMSVGILAFALLYISVLFSNNKPSELTEGKDGKRHEEKTYLSKPAHVPDSLLISFPKQGTYPVSVDLPHGRWKMFVRNDPGYSLDFEITDPKNQVHHRYKGDKIDWEKRLVKGTVRIVSLTNEPGEILFVFY